MVCPCVVLPVVAATAAGGAIATQKEKRTMWVVVGAASLLALVYVLYPQQSITRRTKSVCLPCMKKSRAGKKI